LLSMRSCAARACCVEMSVVWAVMDIRGNVS